MALIEARNCAVVDNVIEWTRTASDLQGQAWSPLRAPIATYNEVSHCRFSGNMIELVPGSEARAAIIINGDPEPPEITTRISITDNDVHDLAGTCDIAGIYVAGASGHALSIAGNRLEGVASDGIHVMTGDDVDLRDNRVTGLGGADTTAVRIGNGSQSRVLGNICRGFGRGLLVAGHASPTVVLNDIDDCGTGIDLYQDTSPVVALNRIGEGVATPFVHADEAMPPYSVGNGREARMYDVSTVAVDELAAVVGTILSDLRAAGIVR